MAANYFSLLLWLPKIETILLLWLPKILFQFFCVFQNFLLCLSFFLKIFFIVLRFFIGFSLSLCYTLSLRFSQLKYNVDTTTDHSYLSLCFQTQLSPVVSFHQTTVKRESLFALNTTSLK